MSDQDGGRAHEQRRSYRNEEVLQSKHRIVLYSWDWESARELDRAGHPRAKGYKGGKAGLVPAANGRQQCLRRWFEPPRVVSDELHLHADVNQLEKFFHVGVAHPDAPVRGAFAD